MKKRARRGKAIIPESIGQHIEKEYMGDPKFRKAYDEEVIRLNIAYKIAHIRKMRHISQRELAKRVGTSQQNISRLEDTTNAQITIQTLARLAKALRAKLSVDLIPQE